MGRRADMKTNNGPQQTTTLNLIVDDRSVFFGLTMLDKSIEAVCDCGASVLCFSRTFNLIYKKLTQLSLEGPPKA